MNRTPLATLVTVAAIGMIAAAPALAQQGQGSMAPPGRGEAVPLQPGAEQIRQMQLKLNQLGFSSGHVDGIWGPETSTAVLHFQQMKNLHATGKLDDETLRALGLTGAAAASPTTVAQAVSPQATPAPATLAQPAPASMSGAAPGTNPGGNIGRAAADGRNNQAVATTRANAPQPAHGANSFTKDEAQARISREGFQEVGDLSKDNAGVWRGKATKNGQPVHVWLDYKGNVGQE